MYLTDYREYLLKDVITQFEPGLFKKVTGLSIKDFELLVSLGLFNDELMNDAVYNFKRYEDSSLEYSGLKMHADDEDIGLFSTVISKEDYKQMAAQQGSSMELSAESEAATDEPSLPVTEGEESRTKSVRYPTIIKSTADKVAEETVPLNDDDIPEIQVDDVIQHKKFGKGTVIALGEDKFSVQFEGGIKTLSNIVLTNGIVTIPRVR